MPTSRPACITTTAPIRFSAISRIASITGASGPIAKTSGAFASSKCRTVRMAVSFRQRGCNRGYSRRRAPAVDDIQGPLLGFHVQPAEVFADQAERDQLHAAEEQDDRHHG